MFACVYVCVCYFPFYSHAQGVFSKEECGGGEKKILTMLKRFEWSMGLTDVCYRSRGRIYIGDDAVYHSFVLFPTHYLMLLSQTTQQPKETNPPPKQLT